jgi:hypothetical protein
MGIYFISGLIGGGAAVYSGQPLSAGASAAVLGLLAAAIVFEFFAARGSEKLMQKNNFSTLIFILVINLIIGAVEKGVDNSAHLGGLIGGGLLGLVLLPVLASPLLKRVVGIILIWLCVFVGGTSGWQLFGREEKMHYPYQAGEYAIVSNASASVYIELPLCWKVDTDSGSHSEIEAIGPFKERMMVLTGPEDEPAAKILEEYVQARTEEIEKSEEIALKSRRGPELIETVRPSSYRIRWALETPGGPMSVVDYLVFTGRHFFLLRYFIGTENDPAYETIMNKAVSSIVLRDNAKQ